MSEMALTAQHFIIIGRGRLIADVSGAELAEMTQQVSVRVRSPHASALREVLARDATDIVIREPGLLEDTGLQADDIGARAWAENLQLQELTPLRSSLEEIFMELTKDAVEYHGSTDRDDEREPEMVA
jgi:ABC-2 type transport system ATP-binding protein